MADQNSKTEAFDIKQFSENYTKALNAYQQVVSCAFANQNQGFENVKLDPLNMSNSLMQVMNQVWSDPQKAVQNNIELTQNYLNLWSNVTQRFMGQHIDPLYKSQGKDNRFKDEAWENHPMFDFIKQSYFMNAAWMQDIVKQVEGLTPKEEKKLEFYTKMIIDAMAPTNFAMTNPEVLKETLASNGANLVKGAENLYKDMAKSKGQNFKITTTDFNAFEVGKNLAVTPGKVVYQNDLIQLIQYSPLTEKVYKTPVVIMPAWINKYYILDLQDKNSYVRWLVEQGYTVFMISWVNPNETLGHKTFDDYMLEGPLSALKAVQEITGEKDTHFMGYCLGGTLLAATIAYLKAKKTTPFPIKTATFLTSLVDFNEAGDLGVFIDDEQLSVLEKRMSEKGYLDGHEMAQTFSMIRANDMIWSFYVNNYLMGKDPFPFDILYWNADSTRLPAKMHSFYLRNMYEKNLLVKPNALKLCDTPIDLRNVDIPVYILSTREDHITPWESTYSGTQIYSGPVRFTLSGSGHVAGVVNHPSRNKYNHWTNDKIAKTSKEWLATAKDNAGSWWTDWNTWAAKQSGEKIAARSIKEGKKPLENAPGAYVKLRLG
jgi:polyhydroxyalkanoate synthase